MKHEFSTGPKPLATTKKAVAIDARVDASHPLFDLVFGTAHGLMIQIAARTLVVFPQSIEDYLGPYKGWARPSTGLPIYSPRRLETEAAAQNAFADWAQTTFEDKWRFRRIGQVNAVRDVRNLLPRARAPIECSIVAYSLGDTPRALAQARLIEVSPKLFTLVPFYLRELCGPDVPWLSPEPGSAIQTNSPITSFNEAHDVLAWWATKALAMNRKR